MKKRKKIEKEIKLYQIHSVQVTVQENLQTVCVCFATLQVFYRADDKKNRFRIERTYAWFYSNARAAKCEL